MVRVWSVLAAWTLLWCLIQARGGMYSWHYFLTGAHALVHLGAADGGVHLYAAHPELQMGPLTLVAAAILAGVAGPWSATLGAFTMIALGLMSLWLLVTAAARIRAQPPSPRATLLAGIALIPAWTTLSVHYGHLDDALAITLTVAALVAVTRDRAWMATLLIAGAAAAKPWALPFALTLLAHPADRLRRSLVFGGASILVWAPFLLGDPRTLSRLGSFAIVNAPDSALRALGVDAMTTPPWDRAAQLCAAAALGLWCLRTGRTVAIPAIALAGRLILDPGTYPYYTASLLLAVLCVDLLQRPDRTVPWLTTGVATWFVFTGVTTGIVSPATLGIARAVFLLALIACLASSPADRHPVTNARRRITAQAQLPRAAHDDARSPTGWKLPPAARTGHPPYTPAPTR